MRAGLRFWMTVTGLAVLFFWVVVLAAPRLAFAEAPGPRTPAVHVLGIDSDDAEDQADAMTGALRSRIRSAPGWSLQETQHALGMLTAALRCPPKPDAACLQRIGDQLHTDRFVWGVMSKGPANQVTAEIHLWARGKPDSSTRETYSDNLRDQNDETLRRMAARILDKISGSVTTGTVTVRASEAEGETLWINGQKYRALEHGGATIELVPGKYDVEVRAPGYANAKQDGVQVSAGLDTTVSLKLETAPPAPVAASTPSNNGPKVRKIIGWSLVGLGVVAGVVAVVEGVQFVGAKNDLDAARKQVPSNISDVCSDSPTVAFNGAASTACAKYNQAASDRTGGIVAGSIAGVLLVGGSVLLLTAPRETNEPPGTTAKAEAPRFQVFPYAFPRGGGGVDLSLTF
jgi:hypothetical protein